jgi:hypothetical protein
VRIRSLVSCAASLFCAGPLAAQYRPSLSPAAPSQQWQSFIGANPLGIGFDLVSVEAETAIGPGETIGGLASYNDVNKTRFTTFDAKFKYYPGEVALQGFSAGVSVGYTKFDTELPNQTVQPPALPLRGVLKAPTLGLLADYNFTMGPTQRFLFGTGIGAKRILSSATSRDPLGLDRAYLTARFVVGMLF